MAKENSASHKPFALLVNPAPALDAAKRLAAHLPPYSAELMEMKEEQAGVRELLRQSSTTAVPAYPAHSGPSGGSNSMPASPSNPKTVSCPRCQTRVVWSAESPFRPFCSERCKLMDLGAWAAEKYAIPDAAPSEPGEDQDTEG